MAASIETELLQLIPPDGGFDHPVYRQLADQFASAHDVATLIGLVKPWPQDVVNFDEARSWLPVHAWRILARQRSLAVIDPLLEVADHPDDYLVFGEFAALAVSLGPRAVPELAKALNDPARSEIQRMLAARGLGAVARQFADAREPAVSALQRQLENAVPGDGDIGAASAEALIDLHATEAGNIVRAAYAKGLINLGIGGSDRVDEAFPEDPKP